MIYRLITKQLKKLLRQFPVVCITGPRQSGKTTLVKNAFPKADYITLEDPDIRAFAKEDPRGFLDIRDSSPVILDEVQRVPELFSYIQTIVDNKGKEGLYILTGSFHFGLMEGISQSLAGRAALLELLPFSFEELDKAKKVPDSLEALMFKGCYPRLYDKAVEPSIWYANYVATYIERDVRMLANIANLDSFQHFLKMCAARSGQILNLSSLGDDCGISHNTAKAWISILQTSFIIYLLRPYHKNFNKRLIKSPKLYFYDTGLLSYLLDIQSYKDLSTHALRGHIFETWVMAELLKAKRHKGLKANFYFWRDRAGHEIDCIIEKGSTFSALEIKSGKTVTKDYFKGLEFWKKISGRAEDTDYLVYGGDMEQKRKNIEIIGWKYFANSDLMA